MDRHTHTSWRLLGVCALSSVLLLGGCARPGMPPSTEARMWVHFDAAAELQYAMVLGDLNAAQSAARRLSNLEGTPGLPAGSEDQVSRIQSYARDIQDAESFGIAALAASHLAETCGSCHMEYETGPVFTAVPDPPEAGATDHMVEHVWAADRMWEGLVIPSDERWDAGAQVLAEHVVPMEILSPGTSGYGVALKTLGLEAARDEADSTRVRRYADVLVTCATCHTASR